MGNLKRILKNVRFRFAHLTILLIPLSYFFITHTWIPEKASNCSDQIYFSAHTSKPSVISLFNGKDSLTSWALNSQGYKYLPFTGPINLSASLYLKIENLSERDTFSLLSINLFHDDNVYSLFDKNENVCTIKNAVLSDKSDEINAIVQQTNEPLIVNLLPFSVLKKDSPKHVVYIIIIFILIGTYILVLILSPRAVYIISTSLLASALMFFYFWACNDMQYQVTISTKSKLDRVDFFYNNNPVFSSKNDIIVEERNDYFKSQVDLEVFNFLRCDVDEKTKELSDFQICTKTGILRNSWDYSSLASDRILMNDMIRNGGKFYICGSDPYFALTSSFQIQSIRWISLLRQNIFFLLTIFLFLILISAHKLAEKHNLVTFFFVIAFLVIISFALIVRLFNSDRITLKSEMRNSNPIPVFQLDSSEIFIQKLDDYLKDQLPGRNNLVIMNNLVEYSIFRELINNPIVHFGKDGWLYFIGGAAKENYENRYPLSPQELKKMKEVLIARRDWLHKRGIHFYVIFPPLTHFIYEENIGPRMWRYNQKSKIDQLLEYLKLNSNLDVIDIYNPLMEEKKKGKMQLYFKDNCHWSYKGGYVAYDAVIKYIKNDFQNVGNPIDYNEIIWTELKGYTPDLMRLLAIDKYFSFHECFPVFKYKIPTDTIYPVYYGVGSPIRPFCLNTKRDDRPSMLMYGDSYSACILSFLNNNFDRTIFVGTHFFYPSIIEKEKPDIVIQEMADGTIYDLLLQNPPLPEMNDSMKIQNYSKNKKLKF